jgi:transcriptional regulator with XRE-family HTH domain
LAPLREATILSRAVHQQLLTHDVQSSRLMQTGDANMNELIKVLAGEFADREYAHAYLEENSNMRIAAQVRALRLKLGMSQQELAEAASMRQERISKIEMADFDSLTLKTLRRLAQAFDVHLSVQFSSVADAIKDFVSLNNEVLVCEDRIASLARMSEDSFTVAAATMTRPTETIPVFAGGGAPLLSQPRARSRSRVLPFGTTFPGAKPLFAQVSS